MSSLNIFFVLVDEFEKLAQGNLFISKLISPEFYELKKLLIDFLIAVNCIDNLISLKFINSFC